MSRPARAWLDAQALRHNLQRVKQLAPQSDIMAVVKANGYGHGLVWSAQQLNAAQGFAVASMEEGIALREAGINQSICLLAGFFQQQELPLLEGFRLSPVVQHEAQLQALQHYRASYPLKVWLKIDTGMNRLGFAPQATAELVHALQACASVEQLRLLSHFANADDSKDPFTTTQIQRFIDASNDLEIERSMANSAGICAWPESHMDWVRPGIMLYGVSPLLGRSAEELQLRPVMTLSSALISIKTCRKGETVGYGGAWRCPEDMPVGVVAIGYGDGYPRHAPPGTPVLLHGQRVPLIGRVSMDLLTIDLRTQAQASVGDEVVLWGRGLPVEDIATVSGTIAYELLCQVTERVPRVDAPAAGTT